MFDHDHRRFRLAPMSAPVLLSTVLLMSLPLLATFMPSRGANVFAACLIAAICGIVWAWFRPSCFVIDSYGLRVKWPLRTLSIPRHRLRGVAISPPEANALRGIRVGVGGFLGSFGRLVGRENADMYISRRDGLVRVELSSGRPLLITPEHPEEFVDHLQRLIG